MSLSARLDALRRSVAVRMSLWFAALFTACFCAIFGLLYWLLGEQLEAREHEALGVRLSQYRDIYAARGLRGLQERVYEDSQSPHVRSLFIRLLSPQGVVWASVPPDWIDKDAKSIAVPDELGRMVERQVVTLRIPRDEQEDLAVLMTNTSDGLVLQVARSTDSRTALLEPLRRTFLRVGGATVLVGFVGGALLARRATRPLQQVVQTARRIIATGELTARVPATVRDDDIADLVRSFNTVLERNGSLIRSMREALDNVAHDLRTPLSSLRGNAELALGRTDDPLARDALGECIERTDEVLKLLRALMEVAEAEAGVMKLNREPADLAGIANQVIDLYSEVAEDKGLSLRVGALNAVSVSIDATRVRQAVANLVDNALKYTPAGGRVTVDVYSENEYAVVRVSDTGPGVPEAEQPRIWDRLYRCDQSRSEAGLGLGLSLVRAIAQAHGGLAKMQNSPTGGAEFFFCLPHRPHLNAVDQAVV
ncbi:sensor histidine kinase [Nibricoccus sp. IMCC34717]|uniref:sensor histidine kinase n=1 Tax=Nibricoccus sp. IMCC34717 TaxID=3034021 RepID=UPI00384F3C6A